MNLCIVTRLWFTKFHLASVSAGLHGFSCLCFYSSYILLSHWPKAASLLTNKNNTYTEGLPTPTGCVSYYMGCVGGLKLVSLQCGPHGTVHGGSFKS